MRSTEQILKDDSTLRVSNLCDLSLMPVGTMEPTGLLLMKAIAAEIPSIRSFYDSGHMHFSDPVRALGDIWWGWTGE